MTTKQKQHQLTQQRLSWCSRRYISRLINISTDIASKAGKSLVKASQDYASIEGAYRFVRNDYVSVDEISKYGFFATEQIATQTKLVLSFKDMTGSVLLTPFVVS